MRKIALLVTIMALGGCMATIYEPALDIKSAILLGPKGETKFEIDSKYAARLIADDGNHRVTVSLFPIGLVSHLRISSVSGHSAEDAVVNLDQSYYTLNDGEKTAMDIKREGQAHFKIYAPSTMDYYVHGGDGLSVMHFSGKGKLSRKHKEKMANETYHYHLSLTLNGTEYIIDVKFKLDYSSRKEIRVPATP